MADRASRIRRRGGNRGRPPRYRGTGIWWGYVAALVALAAVVALVVQNDREVTFEWLWIDFSTSLAVMLLVTALVSIGATSVVGLIWRHHRRRVLTRATAHAESSESQVADEEKTAT